MAKSYEIQTTAKPSEWNSVAERAALALLFLGSGSDQSLLLAMSQKYKGYITDLLADGPEPTNAERLAATRAAHNWMAVNILESKAMLLAPASSGAMMIDRRVTLAEKRLHSSLKSLAVLRRHRKPASVKKQVNIANDGPMVVSNG